MAKPSNINIDLSDPETEDFFSEQPRFRSQPSSDTEDFTDSDTDSDEIYTLEGYVPRATSMNTPERMSSIARILADIQLDDDFSEDEEEEEEENFSEDDFTEGESYDDLSEEEEDEDEEDDIPPPDVAPVRSSFRR